MLRKRNKVIISLFILCVLMMGCQAQQKNIDINNVSFRLQVEDVFSIKDRGTVVVGTIDIGEIQGDSEVLIVDETGKIIQTTTLFGIETLSSMVEEAYSGDNVGLGLKNVGSEKINKGFFIVKE